MTMEHTKNLDPEYNIPVDSCDIDPEVVSWFHSSQWDPVYAIGSRLVAYGKTLASLTELESLESRLDHYTMSTDYLRDSDETQDRICDCYYKVQILVSNSQPNEG